MLNTTNVLFDNENVPGSSDPTWTGAWMTPWARNSRTQIPLSIDITGTVTIAIEGDDVLSDNPIALVANQSASAHILVDSKINLRVRVVSATAGAKVRVTADTTLCYLTSDQFSSTGIG